jgi:hypothetical protein
MSLPFNGEWSIFWGGDTKEHTHQNLPGAVMTGRFFSGA